MEEEIRGILSNVFEVPASEIGDAFSPKATSRWDSAGHMKLIMALEEAFDIMFDDDEVGDLVSVASIVEAVDRLKS